MLSRLAYIVCASLAVYAQSVLAADCQFDDPGAVAAHAQLVSVEYKLPGAEEFTLIESNDSLPCVRFYTISENFLPSMGAQILSHSNELSPEYPKGTTFRIKIKWDESTKVFGAVMFRAASGRAYRADEDGFNTITIQAETIHIILSKSTLDQCGADNLETQSYFDSIIYISSRDKEDNVGLPSVGSDKLVANLRAENFVTPSIDANGALNFYLDACRQNDDGPDLFASGFIPIESLSEAGIWPGQLDVLTDEQFASAFTVQSGSTDITQLRATFKKSYGEEISSDGLPISTSVQGVHFDVSAYKAVEATSVSNSLYSSKLGSGETRVGLNSNAKTAIKQCLKRNGKKKAGTKLVFKKGKFSCKNRK
ncbi:MAG: hypothetical protein KDD42_00145 [Bdellovibrionales bacterium]|nr:hypothetical protein [Bdellovibrionales bacterium]